MKIKDLFEKLPLPLQVFSGSRRCGSMVEVIRGRRQCALSLSLSVFAYRRHNEHWKTSEWRERQVQVGSAPTAHTPPRLSATSLIILDIDLKFGNYSVAAINKYKK